MSQAIAKSMPKTAGFAFQRPQLLPLLMFILFLALISLFFVWSRIQVVHLEYDISSLEGQLRNLGQQNQQLRLEAASLGNPTRIERIARERLGLQMPEADQVILVRR